MHLFLSKKHDNRAGFIFCHLRCLVMVSAFSRQAKMQSQIHFVVSVQWALWVIDPQICVGTVSRRRRIQRDLCVSACCLTSRQLLENNR